MMEEDQNTFSGTAGARTSREACALRNSYFKSALLKSSYAIQLIEPWLAYQTFPFVEVSWVCKTSRAAKNLTTAGIWNNLLLG